MDDPLKEKASDLFYDILKEAARYSFSDMLEANGISDEEWAEIKDALASIGITKTYV